MLEQSSEVSQRDISPARSVSQLVPQFVERPLEQAQFNQEPQLVGIGRQQGTVHSRSVRTQNAAAIQ